MALDGGSRGTTIEEAIYQELRIDSDISLAVALECTQLFVCVVIMGFTTLSKNNTALQYDAHAVSAAGSATNMKVDALVALSRAGMEI